jgi:hypothetical protein
MFSLQTTHYATCTKHPPLSSTTPAPNPIPSLHTWSCLYRYSSEHNSAACCWSGRCRHLGVRPRLASDDGTTVRDDLCLKIMIPAAIFFCLSLPELMSRPFVLGNPSSSTMHPCCRSSLSPCVCISSCVLLLAFCSLPSVYATIAGAIAVASTSRTAWSGMPMFSAAFALTFSVLRAFLPDVSEEALDAAEVIM